MTTTTTTSEPVLEARALARSFRQGGRELDVLKDLDLRVAPGERLAIVGQSGSGKSTLLALLAGLDDPARGEVRWGGEAIAAWNETRRAHERARRLGVVFQQFHLMSTLTALENVRLPLELAGLGATDVDRRARDALGAVGLAARAGHFPAQLSGGERQRVAIARATAGAPAAVLADEPTGSLDAESGESVWNLLAALSGPGRAALVLVTHNAELAARCDRQLRLAGGRLEPWSAARA